MQAYLYTNYMEDASSQAEVTNGADHHCPVPRQLKLLPAAKRKDMALVPYDLLQMYLLEIRQYRVLNREEERELAVRVKEKNDQKAVYVLVTSNLRLVVRIAMAFHRWWTKSLMDLIQEGNVGLLQAVRKFDPYQGVKFSYYASFWIKAYILKYIMENWNLVKIGTTQWQRKLFFNLVKERDKLTAQGFSPEPKLLSECLSVKEQEVQEMNQRMGKLELSLNSPLGEGSRECLGDRICDPSKHIDEQLCENQLQQNVKSKLEKFRNMLSGRDVYIFDNRIMAEEPLTLRELADKCHISRERVRQIHANIIRKARKWLKENMPYLEEDYFDFLT